MSGGERVSAGGDARSPPANPEKIGVPPNLFRIGLWVAVKREGELHC
jgi:hypothetical protein